MGSEICDPLPAISVASPWPKAPRVSPGTSGGCGMQLRLKLHMFESNAATAMFVGPVNVELAGVPKSTWNLYSSRRSLGSLKSRKKFGFPAAGAVPPSQSDGSSVVVVVG